MMINSGALFSRTHELGRRASLLVSLVLVTACGSSPGTSQKGSGGASPPGGGGNGGSGIAGGGGGGGGTSSGAVGGTPWGGKGGGAIGGQGGDAGGNAGAPVGGQGGGGGKAGAPVGGQGGVGGHDPGMGGGFVPTSCLPRFTDGGQLANTPLGKFLLVDMNGDGKLDLVAADVLTMRVFINDGAGHLTAHGSYDINARISIDVAAGDLNGDGRPDVAVAFGVPRGQIPTSAPTAGVYLNSGDGTLTALPRIDLPAAATGIEIGDVDGDHHPDLVLSASAQHYVLPNPSGNGQVGPVTAIDTGVDLGRASLVDLNGDGKLDLLVGGYQPPKAWLNQGGLVFSLSELAVPTNLNVVSSVVTDLDGNGSPDLAMLGAVPMTGLGHRTVVVMLNDGHGMMSSSFTANVDERAQSLAVGDFDRDGHPDLAVAVPNLASPGLGGIVTLMAAAGGTYVASTCVTDVLASGGLVAGDLNGDGAADLAINAGAGINLLFSAVFK